MSEVILIRPGCTDYDEQHRIQGALDLPLNERGEEQVHALAAQLRETALEVIYTAPDDPALSTANAIGEELGVRVKELSGFRNLDQGLWQGMLVNDVRRKYPKAFKKWRNSPESICPPNGEEVIEAVERIREALRKPLKKKGVFGVVASEPLATLIGCVVTGAPPREPAPLCCDAEMHAIEFLHSNGSTGRAFGNGAAESSSGSSNDSSNVAADETGKSTAGSEPRGDAETAATQQGGGA